MDLDFSPEDLAFRDEARRLHRRKLPAGPAREAGTRRGRFEQGRLSRLAPDPGQEGLDRAVLAQGVRRNRLDARPRNTSGPRSRRAPTPSAILPFGVSMLAPVIYTFGTQEQKAALPARHLQRRDLVVPGLFRAGRRARTWRRCGPRPSGSPATTARNTTSSTARRPGPPWPSTPTGASSWSAPIRRPSRRRGSASC